MTTIIDDVTYYTYPAFLVVTTTGEPVPAATATSIVTPSGGAVTMLQQGTLGPLSNLVANSDGVVGPFLASAPQINTSFGSVGLMHTTSEVAELAAAAGIGGYATSIGDGSATSFIVVHGLGTTDVAVQVYRISTGETVLCPVVRTNSSQVTIGFGDVAPAANSMRVLIHTVPITTMSILEV